MSRRHDVATTRPWVADGTRVLVEAVEALDDEDLVTPSLLPGWSRAHVVAHVARNADALVRLATWARTGTETRMYASAEAREAEIERTAAEPAAELRHLVTATAAELDQALDAMDEQAWGAQVQALDGRRFPAAVLPWMRVRETWLHAVDLGTGVGLDDAPDGLVDELAADVTATLGRADGCPAVRLRPTDRDPGRATAWRLGPDGDATTVAGPAGALVVWLTGRSDGADLEHDDTLPTLPRWL